MLCTDPNKEIIFNPYEAFFKDEEPDEEPDEGLDKLNNLLSMLLPHINNKTEPDFKILSQNTGMDYETIKSIWEQAKKNVDDQFKKYGL